MSVLRRAATASRVVEVVAAGTLTVVAGYLGVLTVAAWTVTARRRGRRAVEPDEVPRIAVVIPAHDEERLIGATLDSLAVLDYPTEQYEVHVVADHCTDTTAAIARAKGVEVHERGDPTVPGKGQALMWVLARLDERGSNHDAVAFVDADTIVDVGFLRAVSRHLARGTDVVQGHYAVRDEGSSPAIAFRAAALAVRNHVRPLGRSTIGGTAGLYGNGMVFRRSVLARHGWSAHLTEDAELQLELLDEGVKVAFAPDALVRAEMPATLAASRTQHERWEQGRLELARRFVPTLARRVLSGGPAGRVAYADALLDTAVPPFSLLTAGSVAWAALAALRRLLWPTPIARVALRLSLGILAVQGMVVISALLLVKAPPAVYRALLSAPQMVAWKLRLWVRVLVRPRAGWIRTARNEAAQ